MKIIYYTNQIASPGGLERVLTEKANAWVLKGYVVQVLTYAQGERLPFYKLNKEVSFVDLNIEYNSKKPAYSLTNLLLLPFHILRLFQHINSNKPDVVLVANCGIEYYFFPFIRRGTKFLKEEHLSKYISKTEKAKKTFSNKIYELVNKRFLGLYDRYVVLNKDELKYGPLGKSIAIPNPISLSNPVIEVSQQRENLILSVGRLTPVKQYDKLIDIFYEVHKVNPFWKLKIVGGGKQHTTLQEKIKKLSLEDAVILAGNSDRVQTEMEQASIFALTSKTEGFSMVLLEAMRSSLPIVSFDSPYGPRNVINNGDDGYLIPLDDNTSFIKALLHLIDNVEQRKKMGQRGRANVKRFEVDEVMRKWDNLFTELGVISC